MTKSLLSQNLELKYFYKNSSRMIKVSDIAKAMLMTYLVLYEKQPFATNLLLIKKGVVLQLIFLGCTIYSSSKS